MSEEEDFSKLSVDVRWRHAKWKARQSAYDEVVAGIKKGSPVFEPTVDDLKACASDANVIALESGIKAITAFLQALPANSPKPTSIRQAVVTPIAEKGLVAAKPAVKQASIEALLSLIEVADPAGVVDDLLTVLQSAKSPKAVAAVVQTLDRIFTDFGSPVTPVQPVLKPLPKLFGHADRNVRQAATGLAVALGRWAGEPALLQVLASIKPVQLNEVKTLFSKIDRSSQPSRLTRDQQLQQEAAHDTSNDNMKDAEGDNNSGMADVGKAAAEIDPWDLADPIDVVSQIPSDFWDLLTSAKWKERHEALASVVPNLQKAVRMTPSSDYSRLFNELQRIASKDMNQMCATQAIQGLGALASGLRQQFNQYAQRTLETVVERFKEKKQSVIDVVSKCIDAVYFSVLQSNFALIIETVVDIGMKHKTPQVRIEASKYCSHLLCETYTPPRPAEIQAVSAVAVKLLGDSSEPMRAAAASVLAALVKLAGSSKMSTVLEPLDEHKKKRVNDAVAKTNVNAKVENGPRASAANSSSSNNNNNNNDNKNKTAASQRSQKPGAAPSRATIGLSGAGGSASVEGGFGSGGQQQPSAPASRPEARHPPSKLAPRAPAALSRRPPNGVSSPQSRNTPSLLNPQGPDISMGLSSPSHAEQRTGRPSLSSTPKMIKRTSTYAEFTPARGVDAYRRRIHSPAKSAYDNEILGAEGPGKNDSLEPDVGEVARLTAELELEKSLRLEAEKKLALVQVEKDREILRLQEEVSMLRLQLRTQKQEFEVWLKNKERRWSQSTLSSDDMGNRLSVLSLDADPGARPTSRPPNRRPPSRVLPIAVTSTSPAPTMTSNPVRSGNDEWERAVSMTHSLKKRVEQLRQQKQKGLP